MTVCLRGGAVLEEELSHLCWVITAEQKQERRESAAKVLAAHVVPFLQLCFRSGASVAAGGFHTCAVTARGELVCFGGTGDGQCTVPAGLGPVLSAAAGSFHTCAVTADRRLVCFGQNGPQCSVPEGFGTVVC